MKLQLFTQTQLLRLFLTSILLASAMISTTAFAESNEANMSSSCSGSSDNQLVSETSIADFKKDTRSIISALYLKKCNAGYVTRLDPETVLSWWAAVNPNGTEGNIAKGMNPEHDPTVAHFVVFVAEIDYPLLLVYSDNAVPILLDLNRFAPGGDLYDSSGNCPECLDEVGEDPERPESECICHRKTQCSPCPNMCRLCISDQPLFSKYPLVKGCSTVTDEDREIMLSEIPIGTTFEL